MFIFRETIHQVETIQTIVASIIQPFLRRTMFRKWRFISQNSKNIFVECIRRITARTYANQIFARLIPFTPKKLMCSAENMQPKFIDLIIG